MISKASLSFEHGPFRTQHVATLQLRHVATLQLRHVAVTPHCHVVEADNVILAAVWRRVSGLALQTPRFVALTVPRSTLQRQLRRRDFLVLLTQTGKSKVF